MTLADKKRQKQKEQEAQQKILAKKAENNDDMFGDLDIWYFNAYFCLLFLV